LRILTTEEEIAIREFLIANDVTPGSFFTNEDFRRIEMQAFLAKHHEYSAWKRRILSVPGRQCNSQRRS
jgi:hypothetical protein